MGGGDRQREGEGRQPVHSTAQSSLPLDMSGEGCGVRDRPRFLRTDWYQADVHQWQRPPVAVSLSLLSCFLSVTPLTTA